MSLTAASSVSRNAAWAGLIRSRASASENHAARSTSGNVRRRPLRGGHSISTVLETIVSASALIAQAKDAVIRGISSDLWQLTGGDPVRLSLELLAEAAELGDRFALRLFRETGEAIARAITLTIHLLNPQQIVLGGGLIAAAGKFLLPVIQQHVALDTLPRLAASARIELSTLAEKDWARGAASLVTEASLEEFFLVAPNGASKANPRRTSKKA